MENAEKEGKQKLLFHFVPTLRVIENSKRKQKNSENLKIPLWLHLKPKLAGKGYEREKIKIILPFHSYPRRDRKFQKNGKKIKKKIKNIIVASFYAKIGLKMLGNRENKNYSSVSFLPDA